MRPIVIIVVVAALAAGGTGMLANAWLDRQESRHAKADDAPVVEVLVINRDVPSGAALSVDDLRYESWPRSAATARLVVRRPGEDAKAAFVGMIARRALTEGEPVSAATTFKPDSSGVLAGLLGPGKRAISITITNPTAVSGFITPGDRVDVVMLTDLKKIEDAQGRESKQEEGRFGGETLLVRFGAETVLSDIRVLAIDQQITRGRDGAAIQGKTATLEVTPKQAEILVLAETMGMLQLSLRPQQGDGPAVAPQPGEMLDFTADLEAGKALQASVGFAAKKKGTKASSPVRVNRGGQVSGEGAGR
ncbi:Flp pilus assembly protein RcpC/CpaB [Paramagnetospirillum magnetotacticum MS-1]|uniref:Flp pilus assembly protein RcpC/CpaB n=1 Tax=Paramagnetospirillum magnetotacticum MS-1 TaxID=272627 RepID=A0A0C2YYG4_PARME|nr:Flp pilus assembly protein CpaB [Paramagnetospirillum magnetotacticum]KIL99705.1 Flp pilus assembly protein RcpC/CpaB [Paramagnetospirillum magnetotacticum MS-1]